MIFRDFFNSVAAGFMAHAVIVDIFILGVDWTTVIVAGLCGITFALSINDIRWCGND